jgi:hypothetical protein
MVGAVSGRAGPPEVGPNQFGEARQPVRARSGWAGWLEAAGVALSQPAVALVLRLRLMAPQVLPDPAVHTIYIIASREMFTRYAAAFATAARLREGSRVGFLVAARLAWLTGERCRSRYSWYSAGLKA